MRQERVVVSGAGVPFRRRNGRDRRDDLYRDAAAAIRHGAQRTSKIGVHFDRDAAGQRADADRGAGVAAGIAEQLDHQVGGAIRHLGLLGYPRCS